MNEQAQKAIGHIDKSKHKREEGKNYLLTIGIDTYEDRSIPKLRNAVNDIDTLQGILTQDYDFLLHRALKNAASTRVAIQDALESLGDALTEADNLIIFFSGHGYRKGKTGYIVPADGKGNSTADYITFADLKARINLLPMRHFLFILDCCYAGSVLRSFGDQLVFTKASRRILAACQPEETAQDGFLGGNSPFTQSLAAILSQNESEGLPVKTLFAELRTAMDAKGFRQVPVEGVWQMDSNENGEFVFRKRQTEVADWEAALSDNTIATFQEFRKKYPLSILGKEADKCIVALKKEATEKAHISLWNKTKAENTANAYLTFWQNNPNSPFKDTAYQLLKEREDDELWENTRNIPSRVINYLETYPEGRHRVEAEAILKPKQIVEKQTPPPIIVAEPKLDSKEELKNTENAKSEKKKVLYKLYFLLFIGLTGGLSLYFNFFHTNFQPHIGPPLSQIEIWEGTRAYDSSDYDKAFKILYKNRFDYYFDEVASRKLGWMYYNGKGTPQDNVEAVKWFRKSAEQGNSDGQRLLGFMYKNGRGLDTNYIKAVEWYRKSAEQGNSNGQVDIGIMYQDGTGTTKDHEEAVKWYRKSAEQGNAYGQFNLGIMYENGTGTTKDYEEAVKWYRKSAEQGNSNGQVGLGAMYHTGKGTPQDNVEAVKWYRKSAEKGNAYGQYDLGIMYENGKGVLKDISEAIRLYRLAAKQGQTNAKAALQRLGYSE